MLADDTDAQPRATIVIAEDDVATRMLLSRVLVRERFRVVAVENGKLACEAVRRERPDVVLLDWIMPVMDGREALAELKSAEETRGIPIVMLSSRAAVDERISALEAGVQNFMSKPFDARELVACIEQQMRWRERLAGDADEAFGLERDALAAASERRYQLLAEAMPHAVWIAGARGEFRYFNRAWNEFTGTTAFDSRSGWAFAVHPDDRTASLHAWSLSVSTGNPLELQHRLYRAGDGMYRWHLTRAVPTTDERGNVVEWVGSCSDIHDYRIASETRAILDTMGSIVAIRADDGFVDYANSCWSAYTGTSTGSALGFGWREYVHPRDVAAFDERRNASALADGTHHYELRIRGRDGEYRWFLAQTTLLPRAPGMPRRWLDTSTDIDDLKAMQSALATSETRYRALTDSMPQLVWVGDGAADLEYVNGRWEEYTGMNLAATVAGGAAGCVHPDDAPAIAAMRAAPAHDGFTCEARFRRRDGVYRWHTVRAVPFDDAGGALHKWIGTATDVEDSKQAAAILARTTAELEHLAHHDPMTNLPNRVLMLERLEAAIALARRARAEVMVLYVDLDRFKIINDTLGHAAGDRVLTVTAARMEDALRAGDTASRVGGDEFVLVCATPGAADDAARLATRLIEAVGEPIDIEGRIVQIGASIGISMYPTDGLTPDELIRKADNAMYSAKQSGRNRFAMYHAPTHSSAVAALDLESELLAAITGRQIVVHYQPVISLHTNRLIGAEALVRWEHPRRGLLLPTEFLAFAETHRLIGQIGNLVLDAVCAQIATLEPNLDADFRIAMNVAAGQLSHPRYVQDVQAALARHGAHANRLALEINEKSVSGEAAAVAAVLTELRNLGVALSLDDFGSGSSSLATIKGFPLQALKIGRSFVHGIAGDAGDRAVAQTIITLAHGLGLRAIATGVETPEQIAALRAYGSDAFQGYIASPPLSGSDFAAYLRCHTDRA